MAKRLTIYVSSQFKKQLAEHPDIYWPQVMKQAILDRIMQLEKMK